MSVKVLSGSKMSVGVSFRELCRSMLPKALLQRLRWEHWTLVYLNA